MAFLLRVASGSDAGKEIAVPDGGSVLVGRGAQAQLRLAADSAMSSAHFQLRSEKAGCVLTDQQSTNGTFVNGQRVESVPVREGDRISAGATEFAIMQNSAEQQFGGWFVDAPPPGWELIPEKGYKLTGDGSRSNVLFTEDKAAARYKTEEYVKNQRTVIARLMPTAQVSDARPLKMPAAGDALAWEITFEAQTGESARQHQFYVRRGEKIGIVTTTTIEAEVSRVQPDFQRILSTARFEP